MMGRESYLDKRGPCLYDGGYSLKSTQRKYMTQYGWNTNIW